LFIHNDTAKDISSRRYKGDRELWKKALEEHLGKDFALATGCIRVKSPPGEQRLVLECPSKASRRLLYDGIRKNKGSIKCNISMSALEYSNK
jgi:hypothetical protein